MKWKVGDKLRVLDVMGIDAHEGAIKNGGIYDVIGVSNNGTPTVKTEEIGTLQFFREELPYVERIINIGDEGTERNTELGEPSADCNCGTLTEIHEELTDIKSMIGRLLKEGYEMAPVDDGGDAE